MDSLRGCTGSAVFPERGAEMGLARAILERRSRLAALGGLFGCAVVMLGLAVSLPAEAAGPSRNGKASAAAEPTHTNTAILNKIYVSGVGRLSRGDAKDAVGAFKTVAETAPEIADAGYALALAQVLADFGKREQALPTLSRAMATDASHPLAGFVSTLADPSLSQLRQDGALYLTPEGASRIRASVTAMQSAQGVMRNGRYAAMFLNTIEQTGDARYPARLPHFAAAVQTGKVRLPNISGDLIVGQLFAPTVAPDRFSPYESRIIARLKDGLDSLAENQSSLNRIRTRLSQLRQQLATNDPNERLQALANLDKVLSELDDVIVQNETQISSLKVIMDNLAVDDQIAKKKEELKKVQDQVAQVQKIGAAFQQQLEATKRDLSDAEKKRVATIHEVSKAQKQLNELQAQLAKAESQLTRSERTASAAEKNVRDRNDELAAIKVKEEALSKAKEASEQLDSLKQQQEQAKARLAKVEADVKAAAASRKGDLAALQKQQAEAEARLAATRAQIEAGEKYQRDAAATRQELAQLQSHKKTLEGDLKGEEAKLAGIRAERDRLMAAVNELRDRQTRELAQKAQIAQRLKEVDFGRYYALVIGNDSYKEWPKLRTAVNDATAIADVLEKKYGFRVRLLTNATRGQILNALDDYVDELGPRDNLLVYYAGHGIIDKGFGYWVPVDGDPYTAGKTVRTQNLVKHEDVIEKIQKMQAKQVMVIADSCFAGGLATVTAVRQGVAAEPQIIPASTRGSGARAGGIRVIEDEAGIDVAKVQGTVVKAEMPDELRALGHWASKAARVVLTSGGNEPVIDQLGAKDKNSVFAKALLQSLNANHGLMKSIELTTSVQDRVVGKIESAAKGAIVPQTPSSNNILGYNGEFLFVAKN
jgi:septal ring factor EnvC (AmiA/AmiB activator)